MAFKFVSWQHLGWYSALHIVITWGIVVEYIWTDSLIHSSQILLVHEVGRPSGIVGHRILLHYIKGGVIDDFIQNFFWHFFLQELQNLLNFPPWILYADQLYKAINFGFSGYSVWTNLFPLLWGKVRFIFSNASLDSVVPMICLDFSVMSHAPLFIPFNDTTA